MYKNIMLVTLVDFSMQLIVFHISFMCLYWRLVRNLPGRIKHTKETIYRICDKRFKSILERDNQENKRESFRSSMHWDFLKIVYYWRKVLGRVTLFEKVAGIRRFERMIGKACCAFREGKWRNNKEK